ncbi:unnamed protein product [Moneuplotes crassus]|uniref:C2H2-type domain-containing protein n=1 Tax=Euplotes crassus TaxID=5936 RepID=A0AAD1XWD2_EUPCR|nr:unnamed protein product [Moneuplotes crassus]
MFDFKITQKSSSTRDMASQYEGELVKLLCLPLDSSQRQLAIPNIVQYWYPALFYNGEVDQNAMFINQKKDKKPLNQINAALNSNVQTNYGDHTEGGSFEVLTDVLGSETAGKQLTKSGSKKNKPQESYPQKNDSVVVAKLEDMPIDMQRKKGLLGLQFKIYKTINPKTKRLCTKYVCTHDGCNKQCENKWSFLDHNRHHTGYRPYKCDVCEKRFTQRGNLRQHLLIHK